MCSTKMLYKPEGRKKNGIKRTSQALSQVYSTQRSAKTLKTTSLVICRSALCRDAAAGAFCNAELDAKPT